jgi:hypothetical protein
MHLNKRLVHNDCQKARVVHDHVAQARVVMYQVLHAAQTQA